MQHFNTLGRIIVPSRSSVVRFKAKEGCMDDRLMNVEMQLTFAQETIETLNAIVTEQGGEIRQLRALVEKLERRIIDLVEEGDTPHQKPPHY